MIHPAEDRLAAPTPGSAVVDTTCSKQQYRRGKEDSAPDHASRCRGETDQHDARGERERSHSGMQPATKPWLDDSKHLSERCVSVAFRTRTRGSAFAKMNSRHASPLSEVDPSYC
jgi:hypothetical protein